MKKILLRISSLSLILLLLLSFSVPFFCWTDYDQLVWEFENYPEDFAPSTTWETIENYKNGGLVFGNSFQDPAISIQHKMEYENLMSGKSTTSSTTATASTVTAKSTSKCEHDYISEITTPATCTEVGVMTYTCSKCNDTYIEEIPIDSEAHQYSDEVVEKEATCTEKGLLVSTCALCGDRVERETDTLSHQYESVVTAEPTCTTEGITTYTCKACGDTYTEPIDVLGHTESDYIVDKKANWFFNGSRHKECTLCKEVLSTEVINSRYPEWYLYVGIGIGVLLIGTIIFIVVVVKKNKNKSDNNANTEDINN